MSDDFAARARERKKELSTDAVAHQLSQDEARQRVVAERAIADKVISAAQQAFLAEMSRLGKPGRVKAIAPAVYGVKSSLAITSPRPTGWHVSFLLRESEFGNSYWSGWLDDHGTWWQPVRVAGSGGIVNEPWAKYKFNRVQLIADAAYQTPLNLTQARALERALLDTLARALPG